MLLAARPKFSSPLAGGRGGFAALAALDSDDSDAEDLAFAAALRDAQGAGHGFDPVAALAAYTSSAEFRALADGSVSWGDIFMPVRDAQGAVRPQEPRRPPPPQEPEPVLNLRGTEADFWANDFARNLEMRWWNVYDTTDLTDSEYASMMSWLYDKGWLIEQETRTIVQAQEDDLPPRRWIAGLLGSRDAPAAPAPLAAPGTDAGRRRGAPVPRFCRAATTCAEAGCRYVHGDTIARVNAPCSFGDACGATDPTGVKRSQCLRMHPGETWTEGMVIHRPAA